MLSPRWAGERSKPEGAVTGAGGSGFLVASAFTWTNCTPCGFCTPAAGGQKRTKTARARGNRKAATLAIESLVFVSLSWDKRVSREEICFYCAPEVTWAASYVGPSWLRLTGHGRRGGRALEEVPAVCKQLLLG